MVDGRWASPWVVLVPGQPDAYAALAAPSPPAVVTASAGDEAAAEDDDAQPAWWLEPMFCGWGAQWALSAELDESPTALATQAHYDTWLARLAAGGVHPGTVVIDDKWQRAYGTNEPDPARWPDLAGWIADRHEAGVRVLLWWKAWDPEGLPPEWCVRDGTGRPVALDPTHPEGAAALSSSIRRLLRARAAGGMGATGSRSTSRRPPRPARGSAPGRTSTPHRARPDPGDSRSSIACSRSSPRRREPNARTRSSSPTPRTRCSPTWSR